MEARKTLNTFKELDTLEKVTVMQQKVKDIESTVEQAVDVVTQLVTLYVVFYVLKSSQT
ncbi:MAG: hypothetical protein ACXV2C_01185 [Candidatus Bathyarchaeia archaeon]